jgi:hypothetical protein
LSFATYLFAVNTGPGPYPWIVMWFFVAIVVYQLVYGKLFNLRLKVWLNRNEKPREFWKAFAVEAAVVFILLVLAALTLSR